MIGTTAVRIGELAELTGISRRSLRYYEQRGLLHSTRTESGWREYDEDAATRARNVRDLIGAGLSIDDIQRIAPCLDQDLSDAPACREAIEMYQDRLAEVDRRIAVFNDHRAQLEQRIEELRARLAD